MPAKKGNLERVSVLLGVTGSVAAYKAVDLAGKLTQAGAAVKTVMTANACKLVTPKSFEAVTGSEVFTDMWTGSDEYRIGHVSLADWACVVVVSPASANIIGKTANGICDDLLSTILCACWQKPTLFAPAMNSRMWANPVVQNNVTTLVNRKATMVGPGEGRLACGEEGPGRMAEPLEILAAVEKLAAEIERGKK